MQISITARQCRGNDNSEDQALAQGLFLQLFDFENRASVFTRILVLMQLAEWNREGVNWIINIIILDLVI
ncbi:MAG: hypothetical protein ACJASQ_002704 [Crocinitomicaceae bacterium]|jgi:hypothetical protein